MEDKLQILTTVVGVLTFLFWFTASKWVACKHEIAVLKDNILVRERLVERQAYQEGLTRAQERLLSTQEEHIERLRNWDTYLSDLLILTLEGEDLKEHLQITKQDDEE